MLVVSAFFLPTNVLAKDCPPEEDPPPQSTSMPTTMEESAAPTEEWSVPSQSPWGDMPETSNPFTPDGQGTVVDNATGDEGKEFFTFQTPEGNVFFLVIDRSRPNNNVYFLNAVTEQDLMALAVASPSELPPFAPLPEPLPTPGPDDETEAPELPAEPEAQSGNNGTTIFIVIAALAFGGAAYYLKIVRPKKQGAAFDEDDDEYEYEEEEFDDYDDEVEELEEIYNVDDIIREVRESDAAETESVIRQTPPPQDWLKKTNDGGHKHLTKPNKVTRTLSVLLALVLLIGTAPAALANSGYTLQSGEINTHFLGLQSCTDTEGTPLAPSTRTSGDVLPAPNIENHTYVSYTADITHVYSREHLPYIIGYPDGSVEPERDMTRAEAAMVFHRIFWWTRDASEWDRDRLFDRNTFDDVPHGRWFSEAVETLYNIGVIHGYEGSFRPSDPITREELAVMAARFEKLREVPFVPRFSDVDRGDWSTPYIHAAAERGWVIGYPDGTFRPAQPIIRAEVVTLINRVLERTLPRDQVPPSVNPYNDLVSTHWAFGDLIEATIRHDLVDWHGTAFNDGVINMIIERFVDQDGNEIAETVVREGDPEHHPREFDDYVFYGYITEIVYHYQYTPGEVRPWATKLPNTFTAEVGQTIVYTITVSNDEAATYPWNDVVVTDEIPEGMLFQSGSVYIDRQSVPYTFADGVLRVPVGDIEPGEQVQVQFQTIVADTAWGSTIYNVAIIESDNMPDEEAPDGGIEIEDGRAFPEVTKTANRTTASVGDRITYTITVANGFRATVPWKDVVLTDVIDPGLNFEFGSVLVDGRSVDFAYSDRTLTVELGDIAPETSVTVRFSAIVNSTAIGQTIRNTAVVEGSNGDDSDSSDDIQIDDGTTWGQVRKEADRGTARAGDTITYTITATNVAAIATGAWRNVVVTDEMPEHLEFVEGSVTVNGTTANVDSNWSVGTRTLTVRLGNIAPDETATVTFRARVLDGAQGTFIVNTAIVDSDGNDSIPAPDQGVEIDPGETVPVVTKTADRTTVGIGDRITYTITAGNSAQATVTWRDVVLTDVIDPGLSFEFGSVLINGQSADFSYNNNTRTLTVALGDIAPGASITVTFSAIVNSTAIGQTIRNVAVLEGSNGSGSGESEDVQVDGGTAGGQVTKTADRTTASVGDTITYAIRVTNVIGATGAWQNVVITDEMPEHLEFIDGSVTVNGSTANVDSNFNAGTRTLTVRLGNLAPGVTATVGFRARVLDGAQGTFIVNTAIVDSDGQDSIPAPDQGVTIDAGEPRPSASKSSSHQTIEVGERVTYTITLRNAVGATAPWRNVVVSDVLPAGFSFVHGSVMVDGASHPHGVSGQAIRIPVGDIVPGQTVIITLRATALASGMGQTWYNVATINSDNDPGRQVTCDGTTIPDEEFDNGTSDNGELTVSATKATGLPSVRPGERITYTITAHNPADNDHTWHNVTLTDLIDTGAVTFISGTVTINTVPANSQQHSYRNRLLTVSLGDLAPGQTAVVQFQVVVKPDARDTVIHNTATLIGSSVRGGPQDTMVRVSTQVPVPDDGVIGITGIHMQLFRGFPDGTWRPENSMTRAQAATVFHRILVRPQSGTAPIPQDVYYQSGGFYALDAIRFFLTTGGMSLDASGNFRPATPITLREFNQLSMSVIGRPLLPDLNEPLSRITAAAVLADVQGRSHNPNTNGVPFNTFSDVPSTSSRFGLVTEMSADHGFYLDIHGNEHWEAF